MTWYMGRNYKKYIGFLQGRKTETEEFMHEGKVSAAEALEKLKEGNKRYITSETNPGDVSLKIRQFTYENGQSPYAVVIACSDSRVIPESIFSAGIGELFVIRVAGNVMDNHQLGSVEYAAEHLGCRLVLVLGHERCGAVGAALQGPQEGFVKYITDEIGKAVGEEKDEWRASCLNVKRSVSLIKDRLKIGEKDDLKVCGAVYRIGSGEVEFLD